MQTPAQSTAPPPQDKEHTPLEQSWPAGQALPHAPQFAGSTFVSTHALPHAVVPPEQLPPHTAFEHTCPAAHAMPQPPQFAGSTLVSTHALPHFTVPPPQTSEQTPFEQTSPAGHATLQAPQFARSIVVFAHVSPHCVVPPRQVVPHLPAEQSSPALHSVPHAPQFFGSSDVTTQLPAQSSLPGPHAAVPSAPPVPPAPPAPIVWSIARPPLHAPKSGVARRATSPAIKRRTRDAGFGRRMSDSPKRAPRVAERILQSAETRGLIETRTPFHQEVERQS